jgi:hypothetical protein
MPSIKISAPGGSEMIGILWVVPLITVAQPLVIISTASIAVIRGIGAIALCLHRVVIQMQKQESFHRHKYLIDRDLNVCRVFAATKSVKKTDV